MNRNFLFMATVFALLMMIQVYRACTLSLTYDEAWTVTGFVPQSIRDIIYQQEACANNHILNTLLIKALGCDIHSPEILIRLPNLLAFIFYFLFATLIAVRHTGRLYMIAFTALILQPLILDFLCLARGYGLSLAFLMASFYYLLNFIRSAKSSDFLLTTLLLFPAVWSNLTLLPLALAISAALVVLTIKSDAGNRKKALHLSMLLAILSTGTLILLPAIRALIRSGALWYGGKNGLIRDSFSSLVRLNTNGMLPQSFAMLLALVLILLFVFHFIRYLRKIRSHKQVWRSPAAVFTFLLLSTVLAAFLQHHFLDTPYPLDRTALYFIPLYSIAIVLLIRETSISLQWMLVRICSACLLCISLINLSVNYRMHSSLVWPQDAHTREILDDLEFAAAQSEEEFEIICAWIQRAPMTYYLGSGEYAHLHFHDQDPEKADCAPYDYYLHFMRDCPEVGYYKESRFSANNAMVPVRRFDKEDVLLFRSGRQGMSIAH